MNHQIRRTASKITFPACACALWLAAGLSSFGLGTRLPDQSTEATARGNAFTATADNPSAVYYNPAGITQLHGTQSLIGGYGISFTSTAHLDIKPDATTHSLHELQGVPTSFSSMEIKGTPFTLGFGSYAPFGFELKYPDSVPFRNIAKTGKIEYLSFQPTIAVKLTSTLSFAVGGSVNYGVADLRQGVFSKGDEFHFHGDAIAPGATGGILWQPTPQHSFGLTYFSPTTMHFDGHSNLFFHDIQVPMQVKPGVVRNVTVVPGVDKRQTASANFPFPQHAMIGYSFRPTPDWNFEADLDWTDWDSLNKVKLRQGSGAGEVVLPFNWRSSFLYEFGVTRKVGLWAFSLGYIYSENSVPEASFDPLIPDSTRHIFSAGVGRTFGRLKVDLAYQYIYGPTRTIELGTAADGKYQFDGQAISLSLGYHF